MNGELGSRACSARLPRCAARRGMRAEPERNQGPDGGMPGPSSRPPRHSGWSGGRAKLRARRSWAEALWPVGMRMRSGLECVGLLTFLQAKRHRDLMRCAGPTGAVSSQDLIDQVAAEAVLIRPFRIGLSDPNKSRFRGRQCVSRRPREAA